MFLRPGVSPDGQNYLFGLYIYITDQKKYIMLLVLTVSQLVLLDRKAQRDGGQVRSTINTYVSDRIRCHAAVLARCDGRTLCLTVYCVGAAAEVQSSGSAMWEYAGDLSKTAHSQRHHQLHNVPWAEFHTLRRITLTGVRGGKMSTFRIFDRCRLLRFCYVLHRKDSAVGATLILVANRAASFHNCSFTEILSQNVRSCVLFHMHSIFIAVMPSVSSKCKLKGLAKSFKEWGGEAMRELSPSGPVPFICERSDGEWDLSVLSLWCIVQTRYWLALCVCSDTSCHLCLEPASQTDAPTEKSRNESDVPGLPKSLGNDGSDCLPGLQAWLWSVIFIRHGLTGRP